uniref:MobF family relaxase n=1 Tax=Nocardiopsis sp. 90127 TaxID=373213 RepID=UPI00186780BC|nr:MobF family relaxase [Nocardiopsis sp. 90127]
MARVTPIRNANQGDYRLREECSTDTARVGDAPVEYRLAGVAGHPIERIGSGWKAVGRTPGVPMAPDELDEMRAVMVGADPRTGARLIGAPKTSVAKAAKLPALPLLKKLLTEKKAVPKDSWSHKRLGRLARALDKDPAHTAPVRDLKRIAKVAGVDTATVWDPGEFTRAEAHQDEKVEARVRGWDLTLDAPKSVSVLYALGDPATAAAVENAYLTAVRQTVATVEEWVAHGQRGEHGRGRTARRIETSGLLATLTLHTSARPVNGEADPHLHAHIMISNLAQGVDGKWSGIAAGGRELYTAVPAIGELMRANLRTQLARDLGVRWVEEKPGQWEVAGIGPQVRDLYSRRRDQALKRAGKGASPAQRRLAARRTVTSKLKGQAAEDRRGLWANRARKAKINPEGLVATALGRRLQERGHDQAPAPDPEHLQGQRADRAAARLWKASPVRGVSQARLIGAAAATAETDMTVVEATQLADAVAARGTPAPTGRGAHLRHAARTTAPPVSETDARTGRGPAARAAAHRIAAMAARQTLARQQADTARARIRTLEKAAATATTAWRQGTTKRSARQEIEHLTEQLTAATRAEDRATAQARRVRAAAIEADLATARAQQAARQALAAEQARAAARKAARVHGPLPRPTKPPTAGPGAGPSLPPAYQPHRRPGPDPTPGKGISR